MRNLKIDELFIGAWVQTFFPASKSFSEPRPIIGIQDDGTVNLEVINSAVNPFSVSVGEVLPIPIDECIMRGFGFVRTKGESVWLKVVGDIRLTVSLRLRHGLMECRRAAISGKISCWNEEIRYLHELQRWWIDKVYLPYNIPLVMEWRGVKKEKEEL